MDSKDTQRISTGEHSIEQSTEDYNEQGNVPGRQLNSAQLTDGLTLHGLSRICESKSRPARRLAWFVLLIGMLICYFILAIFSVSKYYRFESRASISRTAVDSLMFPAVSVCQQNQISRSYINNDTELEDWIRYFEVDSNPSLSPEQRINATRTLQRHAMAHTFSHTLSDFIVSCEFDQEAFDCNELFVAKFTGSSECLTFMEKTVIEAHGPKSSTRPGYPFGLKLWINTNVDDYFVTTAHGVGIKVLVHEPGIYPRVTEQAVAVAPGTEAYLSIAKNVIVDLPPPYSTVDCVRNKGLHSFKYKTGQLGEYTFEACMLDCMVYYTHQHCNCSFEDCTLADYYLCIRGRFQDYSNTCDCLHPCEQTLYKAKLSTLALPTPFVPQIAERLNFTHRTEADIQRNMIQLNVFYPSLHYTKTKQTEAFALDELISNLGGQLGLFLGASLLTLVELLEVLFMMVWAWHKKRTVVNKSPFSSQYRQKPP